MEAGPGPGRKTGEAIWVYRGNFATSSFGVESSNEEGADIGSRLKYSGGKGYSP